MPFIYFDTSFPWQVLSNDLPKFHAAYGNLLKSSMVTLKKRDKKKEKQKAEEAALRKKKLYTTIPITGSKRGSGRRKRSRLLKAALKQAETRKKVEEKESRAKA